MTSRNIGQTDAGLKRLRVETTDGDEQTVAYENQGGIPNAFSGDDNSAYIQTPPFPNRLTPWDNFDPLGRTNYSAVSSVNVERFRLLTTWIEFTADSEAAQLSLVGEALRDDTEGDATPTFRPIGVVDPTLTTVTLSGTPYAGQSFASRTIQQAEFRTVALTSSSVFFPLQWDVAVYRQFRLQVKDLGTTGAALATLNLFYNMSG